MDKRYVGARYVPKFANPVEWAADTSYEALTIVTFNNDSYTSKIQVPPTVGNPANNPQYWALTGNYNAQVEQYRQETETVSKSLTTEITNRKNADATLQNNIDAEASTRASADSNLQSQIKQIITTITTDVTAASDLAIAANSAADLSIPYTVPTGYRLVAVMNVVTNFPGIRIENYYYDQNTSTIKVACVNTLSSAQNIRLVAYVLKVKNI